MQHIQYVDVDPVNSTFHDNYLGYGSDVLLIILIILNTWRTEAMASVYTGVNVCLLGHC